MGPVADILKVDVPAVIIPEDPKTHPLFFQGCL